MKPFALNPDSPIDRVEIRISHEIRKELDRRDRAAIRHRYPTNPYAAGLMLEAKDRVIESRKAGATWRDAMKEGFTYSPWVNRILSELGETELSVYE